MRMSRAVGRGRSSVSTRIPDRLTRYGI